MPKKVNVEKVNAEKVNAEKVNVEKVNAEKFGKKVLSVYKSHPAKTGWLDLFIYAAISIAELRDLLTVILSQNLMC